MGENLRKLFVRAALEEAKPDFICDYFAEIVTGEAIEVSREPRQDRERKFIELFPSDEFSSRGSAWIQDVVLDEFKITMVYRLGKVALGLVKSRWSSLSENIR